MPPITKNVSAAMLAPPGKGAVPAGASPRKSVNGFHCFRNKSILLALSV
jgi:hypothetical protein